MFTASAKALWASVKEGESKATIGGMVRFEDATQDDTDDAEVVTERLAPKVAESTGLKWDPHVANKVEELLAPKIYEVLGGLFKSLKKRAAGAVPSSSEAASSSSAAAGGAAADSELGTSDAPSPAGGAADTATDVDVAPVLEPKMEHKQEVLEAASAGGRGGSASKGAASSAAADPSEPVPAAAKETGDVAAAAGEGEDGGAEGGASSTSFEWEETPLSDWARARLSELLKEVEVELPGLAAQIVEVDSVKGEAGLSRGRGKSVLFYELAIKGKWDAEEVDDEGEVLRTGDGEFKVGQFDHDSEPESIGVEVIPAEDGGSVDRELCARVKGDVIDGIRQAIAQFR